MFSSFRYSLWSLPSRNFSKRKKDNCRTQVCKIKENVVEPDIQQPKVVIIGAGMAGLSAAQRLVECGLSNFKILEATDRSVDYIILITIAEYIYTNCFYRTGGRIYSCWFGDVITELGAQHINGASVGNPLYNIACQEGLLSTPINRRDLCRGVFCTSDGKVVDTASTLTALHTFRQIEQQAMSLFNMDKAHKNGSLHQFLHLRIEQVLKQFPKNQRYDAARIMYGLTNYIKQQVGEDLSCVSADQYGSMIGIPGGKVNIRKGYVGFLAPLLKSLPTKSLCYNKPVCKVSWGAMNRCGTRAIIKTCDGKEYPADYVIVTVSLGVLKEQANTIFFPQLPQIKLDAIKNLGFGMMDKIFLEYCQPFWAWNEGGINFAWSAEELADRKDWLKGLSCIEEVEGSKSVLCAYIGGQEAAQMELATDEEVAEGITKLLRQFTGDSTLPYPSTILRTKWATDPYFCGSYSYMSLNSTIAHQCDLSVPIPVGTESSAPILLFAGEATCVGHYSTTHGARLSGIREAERIIQLTNKFKGPPR